MQTEGLAELARIGEKSPVMPDEDQTNKYRTPHTAAPTLTRTSLAAGTLSRVSAVQSNGNASPTAAGPRSALARVSAAAYPNLARASQAGIARASAVGSTGGLSRSSVVKAGQEALRRPVAPESLGITLDILDATTGKPAVYKNDGERFPTSKHTIKLIQGHEYRISIAVEDGVALEDGLLILTFLNAGGSIMKEPVECARKDKTYTGTWACTCAPSAKGKRTTVELSMKFSDFPVAKLPLSAKIYPASKGTSGMSLKSVIVNFGSSHGSSKIKQEQWLST